MNETNKISNFVISKAELSNVTCASCVNIIERCLVKKVVLMLTLILLLKK